MQTTDPVQRPAPGALPKPAAGPGKLPGIPHLIAVGSGKGGVGKSTLSVNLALALLQRGARVGLVDAEILGPSIPGMLGVPTIGQYLQPSGGQMPVLRYAHPDAFRMYAGAAYRMGVKHAASGPLVRSSYRADEQARAIGVPLP